jgi:hypothetical protein
MQKIFLPFLLLATLVIIFSCTKHHGDVEEAIPTSSITIYSPMANEVTGYDDSLTIKAMAIAANTIHGYDLRITKRNDTSALYFYHGHQHNDTIIINNKWGNTLTKPSDLVLSVLVYLDHNGNTAEKKVAFKVTE